MDAQTCIMILSILNYTADILYSFQVQFLSSAVLLVVVVRYINADMHIHHNHSILTTDLINSLVPKSFWIIYGVTVLFLLVIIGILTVLLLRNNHKRRNTSKKTISTFILKITFMNEPMAYYFLFSMIV